MSVAVVNDDVTVDSDLAGHLNLGEQLVENLEENHTINWQFMSYEDAMYDIDHDFVYAVIVIPDHFSQDFANIFKGEDVREFCHFEYYVNEKKNAVGVKVSDTAASTIETSINQKFTERVSEVIAQKVTEITNSSVQSINNTALTISDRLNMVASTIKSLDTTMNLSQSSVTELKKSVASSIKALNEVKSQRPAIDASLNHASASTVAFEKDLAQVVKDLQDAGMTDLADMLQQIIDSMVSINNAISDVKLLLDDAENTCDSAIIVLNNTNKMLNRLGSINSNLRVSLHSSSDSLSSIAEKLQSFSVTKMGTIISKLSSLDSDSLASFMSETVKLNTIKMFEIETYGTGVAPFYSCLTFWIGGFCILALVSIEVQRPRRRRMTAKEAFLARWLLFIAIAIFQGLACGVGDLLIGIQCENVPLFLLTCVYSSIVFVTIIYTLVVCLKHIGKALTVVLVVLQIPGSSGMYPIDIMPDAFKALHPFLPFTYAINALRETIVAFNMQNWLSNIGMMTFMLVLALIIGLYARNALVSLNNLFDAQLRKNGIIECEHTESATVHGSLAVENIVGVMSSNDEYNNHLSNRTERFLNVYPILRRIAIFCMGVVPIIFLAIMAIVFTQVQFDINTKIILIIVWLCMVVAFAISIVILEYIRTKIRLTYEHSKQDLEDLEGADAVQAEKELAGSHA